MQGIDAIVSVILCHGPKGIDVIVSVIIIVSVLEGIDVIVSVIL